MPQSLLNDYDRKCKNFLWNATDVIRKVDLVAWDIVCVPKMYGGLDIKKSSKWNVASVGKLLWQVALNKDVL